MLTSIIQVAQDQLSGKLFPQNACQGLEQDTQESGCAAITGSI